MCYRFRTTKSSIRNTGRVPKGALYQCWYVSSWWSRKRDLYGALSFCAGKKEKASGSARIQLHFFYWGMETMDFAGPHHLPSALSIFHPWKAWKMSRREYDGFDRVLLNTRSFFMNPIFLMLEARFFAGRREEGDRRREARGAEDYSKKNLPAIPPGRANPAPTHPDP